MGIKLLYKYVSLYIKYFNLGKPIDVDMVKMNKPKINIIRQIININLTTFCTVPQKTH